MNFSSDTKIFLGIILATLVIIIGGAVALSNQQTQQTKTFSKAELISLTSWSKGNKDAKVWIVEFSDFQCPACGSIQPVLQKVLDTYKDKILFVYRQYPLPSHTFAQSAGLAAEAAGEQGKFWEYHDLLFKNQTSWGSESDPSNTFIQYAKDIGLSIDEFTRSFTGKKGLTHIQEDMKVGDSVGLTYTPTFYINGTKIDGISSFEQFKKEIDKRL